MSAVRRLLVATVVALACVQVLAEPSCSVSQKRKLYRLDLTVPATFCSNRPNDPSCVEFPKPEAIQLHGLWPNYEKGGFPAGQCSHAECPLQSEAQGKYCKYPEPPGLYRAQWWPELKSYMAATEKCLERHEWVKHGTCSPMQADEYFKWALTATRDIVEALDLPVDTAITRKQFNDRARARLPRLNGALRLGCRRNRLINVYVLYEWGDKPGAPIKLKDGRNHFGNCPNAFFIPVTPS